MEATELAKEMYSISQRIDKASKEVFRLSKERAESERAYREALYKEITKLRHDGVQATLIPDIARGTVADLKFERDAALEMHRSALASLESIQTQASLLQSINRYADDMPGRG
ncbi:hypothetical protein B0H94_11832 [Salsuginibacillus halophilus]|uniref:Uncharacterized protein n=1 Tax=Salsuginibacillus halophilus TaxID=517424 RepID=A0A2P8H693_9BACI|nr:hypothetical protein [Salsuginibacillus halophilus]PSL41719.1 hypothetical protein B0H94_11832 [Salsuginibacillus halophilus]